MLFRSKSFAKSDLSSIFAPACGRIMDISKRDQKIQILLQIPWHLSFAIHAPAMAEVEDFKTCSGKDIFRMSKVDDFYREFSPHCLEVKLKMASDVHAELKLIKCSFGLFPDVWVRQGDLCHQGSVIGVFPFGGTVSLSLPLNYEIIPKVGDMVTGGLSRIANLKTEILVGS